MSNHLTFLQAIAREEGFYVVGSRPQRNNNPGDIKWGHFAAAYGATKGDPEFAVFPDIDQGFAAMKALFLSPSYASLTVEQAINRWAPNSENNTADYIAHVCSWVGCNASDPIAGLL